MKAIARRSSRPQGILTRERETILDNMCTLSCVETPHFPPGRLTDRSTFAIVPHKKVKKTSAPSASSKSSPVENVHNSCDIDTTTKWHHIRLELRISLWRRRRIRSTIRLLLWRRWLMLIHLLLWRLSKGWRRSITQVASIGGTG